MVLSAAAWCDRTAVTILRRRPVRAAALVSLTFGVAVGLNQGLREGYLLASTLLTAGLLACGMFAFLLIAGSYLGIARSGAPLRGPRRRLVDATVMACIAALLTLAFRNSAWWLIGTTANAAGNAQLAELLGVSVLAAFAGGFATESALRAHAVRPG